MRAGKDSGERKAEEKIAATTPRLQRQGQFLSTTREDQVIIVWMRTGHSRFRLHTLTIFCFGESSACHCGTSPMTVEHFPQDCQNHQNLRADAWPVDTLVREKINGFVENL